MKEKELEQLKKELEDCRRQKEEYLSCWKRERADFLNFKKDEAERIEKNIKDCQEDLILDFLPILDTIYLAEKRLPEELKNNAWTEGMLKIKHQILDFLKKKGVKEIECLHKHFDSNFQEAVEEIEDKNSQPGTVVEEIKKGYIINNKVIRPARVKISK